MPGDEGAAGRLVERVLTLSPPQCGTCAPRTPSRPALAEAIGWASELRTQG